jgi:hypothetical protein
MTPARRRVSGRAMDKAVITFGDMPAGLTPSSRMSIMLRWVEVGAIRGLCSIGFERQGPLSEVCSCISYADILPLSHNDFFNAKHCEV